MTADDARKLTRGRFNYVFDEIDAKITNAAARGLDVVTYYPSITLKENEVRIVTSHYVERGFIVSAFGGSSITLNWS